MNGLEMSYILSIDQYTSKYFKGFCMSDNVELPALKSPTALYILNTDTLSGPGEHWCVAFFDHEEGEFFDPFGQSPQTYNFQKLLDSRNFQTVTYNPLVVQSLTSTTCGHHCLFFALHRCRGYSMRAILRMYSTDVSVNDDMVFNFIKKFGIFI